MTRAFLLAFAAAAVLCGCPGQEDMPDAGGADASCFLGDPAQPPELIIVHRTVTGTLAVTQEGGALPLIEPPQGGRVVFVGARAKNLDGCPIRITSSFLDECTGRLLAFEQRDVIMRPAASGYLEPQFPSEIANFSNLAACPKTNAQRNVQGEPYVLQVMLEDRGGRMAQASLHVTPYCAEAETASDCVCLCRKRFQLSACPPVEDAGDYVPGTCPADAGSGD